MLATKRNAGFFPLSSQCDLFGLLSARLPFYYDDHDSSMWHFLFLSVSHLWWMFIFYMKYLLVQHCHGRELSCSTKVLPSSDKFGQKEGTPGELCRSFQKIRKQGTFVQPFRTAGLLCCPNTKQQSLPAWTVESVESGWHYRFCLTRDLQKTNLLL